MSAATATWGAKKKPRRFRAVAKAGVAAPPLPTERQAQRTVLEWLDLALPVGSIVQHVANQSAVDPSLPKHAKARFFEERRKDGVLTGFPDLLILLPGRRVVLVEMKRPGGGRLSKEQKELHPRIRALGFPLPVARTIEDVEAALRADGVPLRTAIVAQGRAA
jgi:hypothetical protein